MDVEPVQDVSPTDSGGQQDALAAGATSASPIVRQVTSSEFPTGSSKKSQKKVAECKTVQSSATVMTSAPVCTAISGKDYQIGCSFEEPNYCQFGGNAGLQFGDEYFNRSVGL